MASTAYTSYAESYTKYSTDTSRAPFAGQVKKWTLDKRKHPTGSKVATTPVDLVYRVVGQSQETFYLLTISYTRAAGQMII